MEEEQQSISNKYTLSQNLDGHTKEVRCLDCFNDCLITGSVDKTEKGFKFQRQLQYFQRYIYSVKINRYGGGYFIGEHSGLLFIIDAEGNPVNSLQVHTSALSSISQIDENTIVTGGWDGDAQIVNFTENKVIATLENVHKFAVCVLAIPEYDLIVTGSQNGNLNFFSATPKYERRKTVEKAHNDIIRQLKFVPDLGILSCSNDSSLQLWSQDGDNIQILDDSLEKFIYSCQTLDLGHYASAGEDKSVQIWKEGQVNQVILHPAALWQITLNPSNQDLISACTDNFVRVFTRDPSRFAAEKEIHELENMGELASKSQPEGIAPEELDKLPTVAELMKTEGKRDNAIGMAKQDGQPQAYQWSAANKTWTHLGSVLGQNRNSKTYYPGDGVFEQGDYDYVFRVQDDVTGTERLLPFNDGGNMLLTSEMYCSREGISRAYTDTIRNFLMKNTKVGGGSKNPSKIENRQVDVQVTDSQAPTSVQNFFPNKKHSFYEKMNLPGLSQKVLEFNDILTKENSPLMFTDKELRYFQTLIEHLEDTSNYVLQEMEQHITEMVPRLFSWPFPYCVPVLDLLRIYLLHPQSDQLYVGVDTGHEVNTYIYSQVVNSECTDVIRTLVLKIFSNYFFNTSSAYSITRNFQNIFEMINIIIQQGNPTNEGLRDALATFFFNISIESFSQSKKHIQEFYEVVQTLVSQLKVETIPSAVFKYHVALGNLVLADENLQNLIQSLLSSYSPQISGEDIMETYSELSRLLQ